MTDAPASALVAIVEDDAAIAEGLSMNLKLQGYRTEVAGDGEAALARIDVAAPDLVLLDISLPKLSGIDVLERLRNAGNHVPVIVLSARQDEFDKVAALRLGADDYVTKPFALAELLARVAAVLRRSRETRPTNDTAGAQRRRAALLRRRHRPGGADGDPRRRAGEADPPGVRAAQLLLPQPQPRVLARGAAAPGVSQRPAKCSLRPK